MLHLVFCASFLARLARAAWGPPMTHRLLPPAAVSRSRRSDHSDAAADMLRASICTSADSGAMLRYAKYSLAGFNETGPVGVDKFPQLLNIVSQDPELQTSLGACPDPSMASSDDVSVRAICPWVYHINYNPLRIPNALWEVKCKCTRPGTRAGVECEPITIKIRVLKTKFGGCSVADMVEAEEHVTVGCTAVRTASSHSPLADLLTTVRNTDLDGEIPS